MKRLFSLLLLFTLCLIYSCTTVTYDNPIDPEGINKTIFLNNPEYLGDEDGDGIINYVDRNYYLNQALVTPPVITLFGGDTVLIEKGDKANLLAMYKDVNNPSIITAADPGGLGVTITILTENVDVYTVNDPQNPYTIIYQAEDDSGDVAKAVRYVNISEQVITDTIPPNLQIGDSVVTISVGDHFDDSKVYAFDIGDASEVPVTVDGIVDTATAGTYVLTYTAMDSHGNPVSLTRTVIVQEVEKEDLIPPTITLIGPDTLNVPEEQTIEEFIGTYTEPGFIAEDDVDGDITNRVIVSDVKQTNQAIYYITYNVKDLAGNPASPARRIIKTSSLATIYPPVIMLVYGDSIIEHKAHSRWQEPGFTITDPQDKVIPNSQATVDSSDLVSHLDSAGLYTITYSVTNSVGLSDTVYRQVRVTAGNDRTPPVITLLGRNPDTVVVQSEEYIDPGYTAIDNVSGDVSALVTVAGTIDLKRLGKYSLLYTAIDTAGNKAGATRIVWVVPDTLTTDLFVRYIVPSPDSLPKISGKYSTFDIDGEGPDLEGGGLKMIEFQWDAPNKQFQLYFTYTSSHKTFSSITQNFASAEPSMNLVGSGIDGFDGKYYVNIKDDGTLVWVKEDKSFALLLSN